MIDRALGLIGLALTLLSGALQQYMPDLPSWVLPLGYGMGVFLLGVSAGLLAAGGIKRKRQVRERAMLRLHIYNDYRTPTRLGHENIFRWYFLHMAIEGIGPAGQKRIATMETLFVSFEEDVAVHTITVRSPDMTLPLHEIKEFNQRYAIVVFAERVPAGTLEIEVAK